MTGCAELDETFVGAIRAWFYQVCNMSIHILVNVEVHVTVLQSLLGLTHFAMVPKSFIKHPSTRSFFKVLIQQSTRMNGKAFALPHASSPLSIRICHISNGFPMGIKFANGRPVLSKILFRYYQAS